MTAIPEISALPAPDLPPGLLCFLDHPVKGDQHVLMKSEEYARLAPAWQR
jgi:hypothetical protein